MLTQTRSAAPQETARAPRAAVVAALGLLALYLLVSLFLDPRGSLGTDTGGKVATLEAMERSGGWSVDVGYWAEEHDPTGYLHPLWGTRRVGDTWVQVTTVPMVLAARPLYELGGVRLALLVPMLGSVTAALAARALARRFGADGRTAWTAFWVTGAASPLLIYATDLWEHSWGLATMGWAMVHLADAHGARRGSVRSLLLAGSLLGLAATMRTEALVFAAAAGGVVAVEAFRKRGLGRAVAEGAALVAGSLPPLVANQLLERWAAGGSIRAGRAGGAVSEAGAGMATRLREAMATTFSFEGSGTGAILLGVVAVVAVAMLCLAVFRSDSERVRLMSIVVVAVFAVRMVAGPGFVPGLLVAAPVAVVGLVAAWRDRHPAVLPVVATILVATPMVWATQFTGGAAPQWGGRYLLTTGLVLTVAGVVAMAAWDGRPRRLLVGVAAAVTLLGCSWQVVRTHGVGDAFEVVSARPEPVAVFQEPFLAREAGAASAGRRWLSLGADPADLDRAAGVVVAEGFDSFLLVGLEGEVGDLDLDGWSEASRQHTAFLPDLDLVLVRLERQAIG